MKSDLPPYGTPLNELSDHYWGILMEIARQWKTGDFSFWTRSIGGGFCLYSSGFYPIWVPLNAAAKFLSYDQFYIFKLIEPYFIGLFSMAVLLRCGLRLSYPLAVFGALAYMGFVFTRYVGIIHHPFFLWACALFPLMLYFYSRLFEKHLYFRSAVLGFFMSLVFIGGGAGQYAQMIIWGSILLGLDALFFVKEKTIVRKLLLLIGSLSIFIFFSAAIAGMQLLPTVMYTLFESSRTLGEYPINNFPLFRNDYKGSVSIFKILETSIFFDGDQGVRAFWALMIFAVGKLIVDWKAFRQWFLARKALLNVALATALFFLFPPVAENLSHLSPIFTKLFNPLRMFTFGYCGFMIDMILVVFMVVLIDPFLLSGQQKPVLTASRQNILLVSFLLSVIYMFLPLWVHELFPYLQIKYLAIHYSQRYWAVLCLLILVFPIARIKNWQTLFLFFALFSLGNQLLETSYVWGEKGRQTAKAQYAFETPEHEFYRKMQGRYFMPYVDEHGHSQCPESMVHNYSLLFGVDSSEGYLNIPPKRLSDFISAYHNSIYWTQNTPAYKFAWRSTPASLTSYFPVEFTTTEKGRSLPWPGFSKKIDGAQFDVWVRDEPMGSVRFAKEVKIVSYRELVDSFDRPFEGVIYMTQEDAARFSPPVLGFTPDLKQAAYQHFKKPTPDSRTFDVESSDDVFVILPEMFQNGWRLKVDGQEQSLFPADSVFIGFLLGKGKHHIDLEFCPVFWKAGWLLTAVGTIMFVWIILINSKTRKRRNET